MLRNGSTPVTSCTSQATRLRELPNRGCPSRPELAPRAELACRARSRGQRCHSVDLTADASSPVSINMHLWWSTRPAVLRSRRLATACMIPSSWPAPDGSQRTVAIVRMRAPATPVPNDSFRALAGAGRATPLATIQHSDGAAGLCFATASVVSPPLADGCFSPAMQKPSRSRRAASTALLLSLRHRPPTSGPEQSSRLDRPRDRFARNPIVSSRDPDESFRSGTSRPRSCALATIKRSDRAGAS